MAARSDRRLRLAATLAITIAALVACAGDNGDDSGAAGSTRGTVAATTAPSGTTEPILVKTRMSGFAGEVVSGSTLGDAPFCVGGTVTHEHGSPDIGFPAINVFQCPEGELRVGFGPGPDQMNNAVQTSDWEVLEGSGQFEGATGDGHMSVEFESVGSDQGHEEFRGTVTRP